MTMTTRPSLPRGLGARAAPALLALFVLAALVCWRLWTPEQAERYLAETGFVEQASAALYLVAAAAVWAVRDDARPPRFWLALSVLFVAFGLREYDAHKLWTDGQSVLKLSWYAGPAPIHHKLVAALVLLAVIASVVHLMRHGAGAAWSAFRAGHPVGSTVFWFVMAMVLTKALDRSLNVVRETTGVRPPESLYRLQAPLEEITELALPVLLLLALLQYALERRRGR